MEETLLIGDHILVPGFGKTSPSRGDVIAFRVPIDIRQDYVKRVIGVPGDHLRIVDKMFYLNGKPLEEPYVQHVFPGIEPYRDNFPSEPSEPVADRARQMLAEHVVNGELVVPPDSYFAMGDNRDNSLDSRYWGFVPRENIIGKPLLIFWSYDAPTEDWIGYDASHFMGVARNFFFKTRWERTLKVVRGYPIP